MQLVRVLGPVTVLAADGRELDPGARRHAEVLALLAAHHGRQVSAETLADLLWRGRPPPSAATTLQGYVSRLRRLLEPGRAANAVPTSIVTVGDGYRLDLPTDADRFEAEVRRARELTDTAPAAAADLVAAALATWRGPAYAEVRDIDAVLPEVHRIEELRVVAREEHARALLAAGADAEVVPDLRRLVAEYPMRERGPALLATALYRSGRQADALAALRDLRDRLVAELGVDPGPELAALERKLLNQDPTLLPAPVATTRPRGGFAGRRAELAAQRRAWEQARADGMSTAVVRGEAGIGKTRLVEELVAGSGAEARWGRCPAAPGAPAYWPWAQVLGELPRIDAAMEAGRFAFGLDLANRLRDLAAGPPVMVVLDDAHLADPDSLTVLEIALDTLGDVPLLLVLTARDDPPRAPAELGRVLAAMARRRGHVDVRLAGLTVPEATSLLAWIGGRPDDAEALTARSGGNPYFLTSLAALGPDAEAPRDVRDTVRARVDALPDGGAELMAALSLAGRDLPVTVAAAAAGRTTDAIEQALAAALRAGLVAEPAPGWLRVGHDIAREAVAADLDPVGRIALHTRLADALARAGAAGTGVKLSGAVAEHRLAAAAGAPDHRAAGAALDAARDALAGAALDEAATWAERGLAVATGDEVRADLHRVAGVAARRVGRLERAEDELRREADIARRRGDWTRLAEVALESVPGGIGGYWALFGMPLLGPDALLAEALTHADAMPAPLRARLLAAEATQRTGADRPGGADLAARALAEAGDDRDARARAVVASILAAWTPDTAPRRLARVEELLGLCTHDAGLEATATHLHRCVLLELGRLSESARADRRFTAIAGRTGDPDLALLDAWWRAGLHLVRGESDAARAMAASAAGTAALASPAAATLDRISRATVEGIAAWHDGRLIDLVGDAADLAADADPAFLLVVALGHAEAGHRDVALPVIDRLLAAPPAGQRRTSWAVMLAAALIALGDADRLAGLLPDLRSYGEQTVVLWPGMVVLGPARLYLGGALAALGEVAAARQALTAALDQARALRARPFVERAEALLAGLPT
ncbi:BTAD domain-containing putative transcriptional regulator [Virgisporangium aurantiacum]|uniref:BTAD domain-containing putative transcriptional regulator n=1 Tax=Virgisporangium aurantiacum TaxID=175570 RepID=UPI00194DBF03|nr:BTAD domain-containing putative transcriptional regulator [Virgisporangium aurantiacum]